MNPYYLCYCNFNGNTPEQQAAIDLVKYRGGRMLGFINWLTEQRQSFYIHNNAYKNGELVKCEEGDEFYKFLLNMKE